jgi:hypothetical protein
MRIAILAVGLKSAWLYQHTARDIKATRSGRLDPLWQMMISLKAQKHIFGWSLGRLPEVDALEDDGCDVSHCDPDVVWFSGSSESGRSLNPVRRDRIS